MVKGDIVMHVPDKVSWEAAASVPCAVGTMGLALFKFLSIPYPGLEGVRDPGAGPDDKTVLIYGGSTATGTIAIQFAKL
jgi:NADPH:quinone reductase-like Zn-dependent oxidoreductase